MNIKYTRTLAIVLAVFSMSFVDLKALFAINLTTIQDYPEGSFSAEWTHVVFMHYSGILYYDARTGAAAVGACDGAGNHTTVKSYPGGSFAAGWTHIIYVPLYPQGEVILYYNAQTGSAVVGKIDGAGDHRTIKSYPAGAFAAGWTHIVCSPEGGVLFFNAEIGAAVFGEFNGAGNFTAIKSYPAGSFSGEWTHLVSFLRLSGSMDILFYNTQAGAAAVVRFDGIGNTRTLKSYPAGSFAAGWTSIVNTQAGFLFYNAEIGAAVIGQIDGAGNFRAIQDYPGGSFSAGWTDIIDLNNGCILFFNAPAGAAAVVRVS